MPVQPISNSSAEPSIAATTNAVTSSSKNYFQSTILCSAKEQFFFKTAWNWISEKMRTFVDWIFSWIPCLGSSKLEFIEDLFSSPRQSAKDFVKEPLEHIGDLFEAILENPKEARKLINNNADKKNKFMTAFKTALQDNAETRRILTTLPIGFITQTLERQLGDHHQAAQNALIQTSKDVAKAIVAEEGADKDTIHALKEFFGTVLPKYFRFESKDEFKLFMKGITRVQGDNMEAMISWLKQNAPERVKADMNKLGNYLPAVAQLFDFPYGIRVSQLGFKIENRIIQNLLYQLDSRFYGEVIKQLGKGSSMIKTILERMQTTAETTKGKELLRNHFMPDTFVLLSQLYSEALS